MNRPLVKALLQNIYWLATPASLHYNAVKSWRGENVLNEVMADQKSDVRDVDNILIMMNTAMWSPIIS